MANKVWYLSLFLFTIDLLVFLAIIFGLFGKPKDGALGVVVLLSTVFWGIIFLIAVITLRPHKRS